MSDYYRSIGVKDDFAQQRWQKWSDDKRVIFGAEKNGSTIGWIAYDPNRSTIEEILVEKNRADSTVLPLMVDALIKRESLLAAEILRDDTEKYRWMIEYGFRPTRSFKVQDFSFIKMDLSTSVFFSKVNGKPQRTYQKKEVVAAERVAPSRTHDDIKAALIHIIKALGGMEKFVQKGQTVAIKPNVVADHGLKDGIYTGGVVTDIGLLKALIDILLPVAGRVIIAEGSSINRAETKKIFTHYGYDRLVDLDPLKVSLVDLNTDTLVEKAIPHGKRMVSRKIPLTLEKADTIINVPVMKTHFAAVVSLAIKNLQGAMPPLEKYMSHFFGLWQNLVNIHHVVKPKLTIMDALTAQEGFGPVYGKPKVMNLLIGGTNPVAVDATAMRIMGLNPAISPPVLMAYMQGMGPIEEDKIRIAGPPIHELINPFEEPLVDVSGGKDFHVHSGNACQGCTGYLHFVLSKLRRKDPARPDMLLIDRPFEKKVNIFLGPETKVQYNPEETNIFMGICQQHREGMGIHLPGCPPHAEVIMKGIFSLFPDMEKPQYADKSAEDKLEDMLKEVIAETLY
jgi:uncharacterized protein (DUF362 family)